MGVAMTATIFITFSNLMVIFGSIPRGPPHAAASKVLGGLVSTATQSDTVAPDHRLGNRESLLVWLVLAGITATAACFVLYGLTRSPDILSDEVFFAEPARMLATSGTLSDPIYFDIAGLSHYFFIQPPVYFLLLAGMYRVFGFNETVTRLGSAVPYLAAIIAAFFLARLLADRIGLDRRFSAVAGLLGAVLLAFNEQSIEMARNARPDALGVLLVLLGWLCVSKVTYAAKNRAIWLSSGFLLLLLATLTHPAFGGPAAGIIVAVISFPGRLGISRRTAVAAAVATAAVALLPYAAWSLLHFYEWRSQFLHVIVSAPSMRYGNFLIAQLGSVRTALKSSPMIAAVTVLGLAAFRWRASPETAGALIGATAVAVASSDPYFKLLLPVALAPTAAGIVLRYARAGTNYRRLTAALIVLAALNGLVFPVARAYEIHKNYQQRDPMVVTRNIERFVPRGAHLMGMQTVYFAAISDRAEYRDWRLLAKMPWGDTTGLQAQFRRFVEQYKPTWFALPLGISPARQFCYLPDRFRRVSAVSLQYPGSFDSGYDVEYALWTVAARATPAC
jgi:4-amino-4-deoxy-L-arabinose transferase-like glycosyltransferase